MGCGGGLMIYSMVIAKGDAAALSTQAFLAWVIIGALIYGTYGYQKNRIAEINTENKEIVKTNEDKISIK